MLRAELSVGAARAPGRLAAAAGFIVVNPPWTLDGELADAAAGACRRALGARQATAPTALDWLAGES